MKVHIVMSHDTVKAVYKSRRRAEREAENTLFGHVVSEKVVE